MLRSNSLSSITSKSPEKEEEESEEKNFQALRVERTMETVMDQEIFEDLMEWICRATVTSQSAVQLSNRKPCAYGLGIAFIEKKTTLRDKP